MMLFRSFMKDENAAVTVDWVVLAGVVIGFGLLVSTVFTPQFTVATNNLATKLSNATTPAT